MTDKLLLLFLLFSFACTQRVICPAYQSMFIYDEKTLKKKFSYFENDSTPKVLMASKTKHLIMTPKSHRARTEALNTVVMSFIYHQDEDQIDSLEILKDRKNDNLPKRGQFQRDGNRFNTDNMQIQEELPPLGNKKKRSSVPKEKIPDSEMPYVITRTKEKYNVDQDNYMWYLRKILELPDVRASRQAKALIKQKKTNKKDSVSTKVSFLKNENDQKINEPRLDGRKEKSTNNESATEDSQVKKREKNKIRQKKKNKRNK